MAVMAKGAKADSVAKASNNRASLQTKCLPMDPDGTLKRFGLQWTVRLRALSRAFENSCPDKSPHVQFGARHRFECRK